MKTTKRIDPAALEGKEALSAGYKIFSWDWSAQNDYNYADENGVVEGSVHTVTGKLDKCGWGLHYSKNPVDCMRFRDLIHWNKFAYVEAYDENIDCDEKSLCRTLKIVKVLSFEEMIEACKTYQPKTSYGVSDSSGVRSSYGVSYSSGVRDSYGVSDSSGVSSSSGVSDSSGVSSSSGVSYSSGVRDSSGVSYSSGVRDSSGVSSSKHCFKCEGISRCIFCINLEGARLRLFNKEISEERFYEVSTELNWWKPRFTNAEKLKEKFGKGEWKATPAPAIAGRSAREAYAEMPERLIEYIKSLPEYDEEIFKAITERG